MEVYREMLGCLLYLSTRTRPDIASAVNMLARQSNNPSTSSLSGIKRVLRYLKGTEDFGLFFEKRNSNEDLLAHSDADWAGDTTDRKSTSGMIICMDGNAVVWQSRKQSSVALSSSEAECLAVSECTKELMWLRSLLGELGLRKEGPSIMMEDNMGAIKWGISEKRAKHVDIRYHYIKDLVEKKEIELLYCPTQEMLADVLTKPLQVTRFKELRKKIGMRSMADVTMTGQEGEC